MVSRSNLRNKVISELGNELEQAGFKRKTRSVYYADANRDFFGLIEFEIENTPSDVFEIDAFAGIYWGAYEEMCAIGWGVPARIGRQSSVLFEVVKGFKVNTRESLQRQIQELIRELNFQYNDVFSSYSTAEAILAHISDENAVAEVYPERILAIEWLLHGRKRAYVLKTQLEASIPKGFKSDRFVEFCSRLFEQSTK